MKAHVQRAASQLVSLAPPLLLNLALLRLLSPSDYGTGSAVFAVALFIVSLADAGLNSAASAGTLEALRVYQIKTSLSFAYAAVYLVYVLSSPLKLPFGAALGGLTILLAAGHASTPSALLIRRNRLQADLAFRAVFATLLVANPLLVIRLWEPTASAMLVGLAAAYAGAAILGPLFFREGMRPWSTQKASVNHLGMVSLAAQAGVLHLPNNILSNGFIALSGILAAEFAGQARVLVLVVGVILAASPVASLHITALASQFTERKRHLRALGVVVSIGLGSVMFTAIAVALYPRYIVELIAGDAYFVSDFALRSVAALTPLIWLMLTAIAVLYGVGATNVATVMAGAAGVAGLFFFGATVVCFPSLALLAGMCGMLIVAASFAAVAGAYSRRRSSCAS